VGWSAEEVEFKAIVEIGSGDSLRRGRLGEAQGTRDAPALPRVLGGEA
jgi:hypothetical protein